jgi:hypothetical protein
MNTLVMRSVLVAVAIFFSGQARSAFIFDLAPQPPTTVHITGVIGFETRSGNSLAGVTEFNVHVDPGGCVSDPRICGAPQDYDLGDIASVRWFIDNSGFLTILLLTDLIPFSDGRSGLMLNTTGRFHLDPCGSGGPSTSCALLPETDAVAALDFIATPRGAISEPHSLELAAFGLLGLLLLIGSSAAPRGLKLPQFCHSTRPKRAVFHYNAQ